MMDVPNEKAKAAVVQQTESPEHSTSDIPSENNDGLIDDPIKEKAVQDMDDNQYPHGLKLVVLASASVIAVFLIALDQVSTHVH
jgi:MFS transporter, DHA2 family, glioxin efflux transporter